MSNRVFGSGKITLTLLIILSVFATVANAQDDRSGDGSPADCNETEVLRNPPLPFCRGTPQVKQNPRWVVVLMSSYLPYMDIDVPVPKAYGPERLRRFGPYDHTAECIEAIERWNNPMVMGYYVECWALDQWTSYRAQWREKTKMFYDKAIADLRVELANIEHDGHRKLLLRQIRDTENLLKDELRER